VWATGLGPDIVGGQLVPDNQPPPGGQLSVPVTVTIDGVASSIPYSGRAPYFAGVDNVYFIVPTGTPSPSPSIRNASRAIEPLRANQA
jgi:uncharacterized protein (TIGR03437 family)